MSLWSDLYPTRHLILRQYFSTPGVSTVYAPTNAAVLRISGVGAGGWATAAFGGGAAFARSKLVGITALARFTVQVGDVAHSLGAGDALGDTIVTRYADSVVVLSAQRGGATPGQASGSIGNDVTRDGSAFTGAGTSRRGGAAAGDDGENQALGFGGRGGSLFLGPVRGGGGAKTIVAYQRGAFTVTTSIVPGAGLACLEWFSQDPGY